MPRWLWFAPLAGLVAGLGLLFYRQGLAVARMTETDVIETYAGYYVTTYGAPARITDCVARPGSEPGVWIVVTCTAPRGERFDYAVNRFGQLLKPRTSAARPEAPET